MFISEAGESDFQVCQSAHASWSAMRLELFAHLVTKRYHIHLDDLRSRLLICIIEKALIHPDMLCYT